MRGSVKTRGQPRWRWPLLIGGVLLLLFATWRGGMLPDTARTATLSQPALFPPDADGDLVRDDVGRQIRQAHSGVTRAALMQLARSWQKMASVHAAPSDVRYDAGNRAVRALSCVFGAGVLARAGMSAEDMYQHVDSVRQQMFDTPARRAAFEQSEAGREGRPWQESASPCDFDPAAMAG